MTRQSRKMPEFDYDWIPFCQFMSLQKLALNACLMNIMTRIELNIEFDLMLQRAIFPIVCSSHVWKWWLRSDTRGIIIKCDIIFPVNIYKPWKINQGFTTVVCLRDLSQIPAKTGSESRSEWAKIQKMSIHPRPALIDCREMQKWSVISFTGNNQ